MAKRGIKEFFSRYYRYFIIGLLFIILVVAIVIFARNRKNAKADENVSTIPELETTVEVPTDKYETDAFPEVNSLVTSYLDAMSNGDTQTMASLSSNFSDTEKAFYEAQAEYTGNYNNYHVYTKVGPKENSYFLFATYDMYITGQSAPLPCLISLYVCKNDSGALYVNRDNLTADEEAYILELVAQKDFADLAEQIELDYNAAIESNEALSTAATNLKNDINAKSQEILNAKAQEEMEAAAQAEAEAQAEAQEAASSQVKCTDDNVNIRASASTDAESIGKTKAGDVYTRYEKMENGWSKIDYNGQEAYIKSDYLEEIESSDGNSSDASGEGAEGTEEKASEEKKSGGKITIKENVNVRASASETGDKIATAYRGEQYDLIEKADGWCKINYKGKECYVKADYVE